MKIHIIGCSGSGKTYLANALSKKYNISHFDLDDIQWDNNAKEYAIPCGMAFERSSKDFPEIELIRSDNRHPTVAGTYLEAAVFFASLTGIAPTDCDFYGRFDDLVVTWETGKKLQRIAWNTVRDFNSW